MVDMTCAWMNHLCHVETTVWFILLGKYLQPGYFCHICLCYNGVCGRWFECQGSILVLFPCQWFNTTNPTSVPVDVRVMFFSPAFVCSFTLCNGLLEEERNVFFLKLQVSTGIRVLFSKDLHATGPS